MGLLLITRWIGCGVLLLALSGCGIWHGGPDTPFLLDRVTPPQRLNARSPWYPLAGQKVELHVNYCGWDVRREQRITHMEIGDKVNRMVAEADELILATFFLFDNLYVEDPPGDYVSELANLLIARKRENPRMPVILILDLFHKGWGHRRSAVVDRLVRAGVDVFYSDLLETRSATRFAAWEALHELGRRADRASAGVLAIPGDLIGRIPLFGAQLDGAPLTAASIANAALVKANHRKALVIRRRGQFETLTTSWNPHNASLLHENHAINITGPLAAYVYAVLREDVRLAITLGRAHVFWSDPSLSYRKTFLQRQLPPLPESAWRLPQAEPPGLPGDDRPRPEAAFATEEAIEPILMRWLAEVQPGDRVRIQMFYLARVPIIHAILDAAARTQHPIELLLDPNRVGINYEKDGTPNAQVADYLLERARLENARLDIRWYSTHGEQNHAKAMTITNETTGKYLLTLGSTNWTRKNLAGINLENNLFIRNSPELNHRFNDLFDRMWSNQDPGIEYSVSWNDPRYDYHRHAGRDKWAAQERWAFLWPRVDDRGRPRLLEQELVHW